MSNSSNSPIIPSNNESEPQQTSATVMTVFSQDIMKVNGFYYPNWRVYRGDTPGTIDYRYVNYVFYAFAHVKEDGTVFLSDEQADLKISCDGVNGCIESFKQLKRKHPYLNMVLSVGGGGPASNPFPGVAADPKRRETFARSARALIDSSGFNGIDIDWEHPSDTKQGQDFVALLAAIRVHLPTGQFKLTTALPCAEWALRHIDVRRAEEYLDLINVMAYDFTSAARAGHHAQLYPSNSGEGSGVSGITYLLNNGFPASKIVLGIPCYGHSFLGATAAGDVSRGNGGEEGTFEYKNLPRNNAEERVDAQAVAAYCIGGDGGFVSYDNPETVKIKAGFVKSRGLAGLFYWTGTADTSDGRSLMSAGFRSLHNA